jgi:anti-anti-sigma regulatory factor
MIITVTNVEKPSLVTILHLEGKLDRANYEILIDEAQEVYGEGVRDLILDMSKLTYISSAGVSALHQVALLFQGETSPHPDGGWAAFRPVDRARDKRPQGQVRLFSPAKEVREILDLAGFGALFEIFTDLSKAVASFRQSAPVMGVG